MDFWSAVLGYRPRESEWDPEFMMLVHPDGRGLPVSLQPTQRRLRSPCGCTSTCIRTSRTATSSGSSASGAPVDDWPYPEDADFIVLRDPDGNEFCVIDHAAL